MRNFILEHKHCAQSSLKDWCSFSNFYRFRSSIYFFNLVGCNQTDPQINISFIYFSLTLSLFIEVFHFISMILIMLPWMDSNTFNITPSPPPKKNLEMIGNVLLGSFLILSIMKKTHLYVWGKGFRETIEVQIYFFLFSNIILTIYFNLNKFDYLTFT